MFPSLAEVQNLVNTRSAEVISKSTRYRRRIRGYHWQEMSEKSKEGQTSALITGFSKHGQGPQSQTHRWAYSADTQRCANTAPSQCGEHIEHLLAADGNHRTRITPSVWELLADLRIIEEVHRQLRRYYCKLYLGQLYCLSKKA